MIREPYNLNPYNSTIDTSKVNNFSFTFSGDELGSWNIEIAKNNTSPEIVYTSEEFVPEDVGYTHIYDDDIVEGITLPSTIAHSQGDDGLLRRLYSINGYPFNAAVVKLNVNGIENIGNIKGSTANGYLVATNYSLGRTGSNVTIIGFDRDGTTIGSQVTDGTYDFLGYLLSVKENSNIEVGQVVQIGGNSFVIGSIEDAGDGYSELTIVNGEATSSDVTPILTFDSLAEADVTELTVGIEPVQDLNGYDKPWVGGAGKNLCPNVGWVQGQLGNNGTLGSQSFSISSDYIFLEVGTYVVSRSYSGGSAGNLAYHSYNTAKVWQSDSGWLNNPFIITVTEPIFIRFTTRKNTSDALSPSDVDGAFKIQLEQGSTATAWTPYSNICPITGHDEVTVTRTGKNLITGFPSITQHGVTFTANAGGSVTANGTATGGAATCFIGASRPQIAFFLGKKEVILSGCPSGGGLNTYRLQWWKYGVNSSGGTLTAADYGNGSDPFFPTETSGNIAIYINNGVTVNNLTFRPMVRLASETDDTYEPYQGSTYTASLGQTVYGGTLDMVTGQLVVDKAMVDLGSLTWLLNSSLNGKPAFYVRLNDAKTVSASSVADMTTSCYSVISADNLYLQKDNTGIIALNGQNYLQVRDTRYSTASDYKSGITGQQLVYELATPLTYTLTPQQIKTLVGTNNVWASSGDIVSIKFTYETN